MNNLETIKRWFFVEKINKFDIIYLATERGKILGTVEDIKNELIDIYNVVIRKENVSIERCRLLENKLFLLKKKLENLQLNYQRETDKIEVLKNIIRLLVVLLGLGTAIMMFVNPLFAILICAINFLFSKLASESIKNIGVDYVSKLSSINELGPLYENCNTFLGKRKVEALNRNYYADDTYEEEISEKDIIVLAIDLVNLAIYGDVAFDIPPELQNIAVRILQMNLNSEESDLCVLIEMARKKVKNEINLTQSLQRNAKK